MKGSTIAQCLPFFLAGLAGAIPAPMPSGGYMISFGSDREESAVSSDSERESAGLGLQQPKPVERVMTQPIEIGPPPQVTHPIVIETTTQQPRLSIDASRLKLEELTKKRDELLLQYVAPNFDDDTWVKRSKLRRESEEIAREMMVILNELGNRVGLKIIVEDEEEKQVEVNKVEDFDTGKVTNGVRDMVVETLKKAAQSIGLEKKLTLNSDKAMITRTVPDPRGGPDKKETARTVVDYDEQRQRLELRLENIETLSAYLSWRGKEPDLGPGGYPVWTRARFWHEFSRRCVASFFKTHGKPETAAADLDNLDLMAAYAKMWQLAAQSDLQVLGQRQGHTLMDWVPKMDRVRKEFFKECEKIPFVEELGFVDVLKAEVGADVGRDTNESSSSEEEDDDEVELEEPEVAPGVNAKIRELNRQYRNQRLFPANPLGDLIKIVDKVQNYMKKDKNE